MRSNSLRSSARARRGFTLIELLTVIAIVGVLAAIVIPAVGSIRQKAYQSASASNLRQWAAGLGLYVSTNGRIPYEGAQDQPSWAEAASPANENAWFNVIPPLIDHPGLNEMNTAGKKAMMVDPNTIFAAPGVVLSDRENRRNPLFSYMMNSQIYSDRGNAPSNSGDDLVRSALIDSPSATIFMTETRVSEDDGPPGSPAGSGSLNRSKGRNNNISFRFGNTVNVVFLDGHVAKVDAEELYNGGADPASGNQLDYFIWFPWSTN